MKALGYFALILSVMYMLACQGSGGGGGSTTKDNVSNLNETNTNNYQIKPQSFGGLSTDIVGARIVYKQFTTSYGQGVDKITGDSCASANKNHKEIEFQITGRPNVNNMPNAQQAQNGQYNNQQMMMGQQYNPYMQNGQYSNQQALQQYQSQLQQQQYYQTMQQQRQMMMAQASGQPYKPSNIEFNFDGNGVLLVRITDYVGVRTSQPILPMLSGVSGGYPPPNTYVLVPPSTLIIGAFTVTGTPDSDYITQNLTARGLIKRAYEAYDSSYQYSQANYTSSSEAGFRIDYEPGQNPNLPAPKPQVTALGNNNSAPVSAASSTFDPIVLKVLVAKGINRNHIFQLELSKQLTQHSSNLLVDANMNAKSCYVNSDATIKQLIMVKAN